MKRSAPPSILRRAGTAHAGVAALAADKSIGTCMLLFRTNSRGKKSKAYEWRVTETPLTRGRRSGPGNVTTCSRIASRLINGLTRCDKGLIRDHGDVWSTTTMEMYTALYACRKWNATDEMRDHDTTNMPPMNPISTHSGVLQHTATLKILRPMLMGKEYPDFDHGGYRPWRKMADSEIDRMFGRNLRCLSALQFLTSPFAHRKLKRFALLQAGFNCKSPLSR